MWLTGDLRMALDFCRLNLRQTDYQPIQYWKVLEKHEVDVYMMTDIYRDYCNYKNYTSVLPIFDSQWFDKDNDVFLYYDVNRLPVAWSLCRRYDSTNVESIQFAWDYKNPRLRLGIKSLETECWYYRDKGFKYLYLGTIDEYKTKLQGFERLGTP